MDDLPTADELVTRTRLANERTAALPEHEARSLPPIDWKGLEAFRPEPITAAEPSPSDPLPGADVVIITWTVAEWAAMAHVFCDYDRPMTLSDVCGMQWRKGWSSFFKVLGIKGEVKFCGTNSSNWSATVDVCLTLLGNQVACHHFDLDPTHLEYCYNIDVRLAKAKVCFGVNVQELCLYTRGKACAWGLGWHCQDFDQNIICLPH